MGLDRRLLFRLATSDRFERSVRALPGGGAAALRQASRYVAGTTAEQGVARARSLAAQGFDASLDLFGERVTDSAEADAVAAEYLRLAAAIADLPDGVWLAADLSHLGLATDPVRCADHLAAIAAALPPGRRIQTGAEESGLATAVRDCVLAAAAAGGAGGRVTATLQANLRRSPGDLDRYADAGIPVRLVKGAYVEPAEAAFRYGEQTDLAYLRLARRAADAGAEFSVATHDGLLREAVLAATGPRPVEQLLGVRPETLDELAARGVPVRVYVPFGADWFRYWMRRVAESRGA